MEAVAAVMRTLLPVATVSEYGLGAVAAVMRALLLLVVFGVLAGVFTRLCSFPPAAGCGFTGLVIGRGRGLHRVGRHWSPGVASRERAGRRAHGLVRLAMAAALFHVMARAGAAGWSTVVLRWDGRQPR